MSQPSQGAPAQPQTTSQGANSAAPAVGQQTPTPAPTASGADSASSATPGGAGDKNMSTLQLQQLRAQIMAYKLLSRGQSIPEALMFAVQGKLQQVRGPMSPHQLLHGGNKNRLAPVAKPPGIDPQDLLQERENRLANRIQLRLSALENLPSSIPQDLQTKATIEMKALRLLDFQRRVDNFCEFF